jgi:predicted negative regulator of RcsB-dependent stress response
MLLLFVVVLVAAGGLVGWSLYSESRQQRHDIAARTRSRYSMAVHSEQAFDSLDRRRRVIGGSRSADLARALADATREKTDSEKAYIDACRVCVPAVECERDRLVIESGRASDTYNPCD